MVSQAQLDHFRPRAVWATGKLRADFPRLGLEDCFAILGNGGHESIGFTTLQEIKPVVPGSRGGTGWFMWTGPRRRAFEAYCARNGKDPASDEANYAWLFLELKGSEKKAIDAVTSAVGLYDKVVAFEKAYERAGVKHYDSRRRWAEIARDVWNEANTPSDVPDLPTPFDPTPVPLPEGLPDSKVLEVDYFLARLEQWLAEQRADSAMHLIRDGDPSWPIPTTSINSIPKGLPMDGVKTFLKSKTILSLIVAGVSLYSPAIGSILGLFGIGGGEVDPSLFADLEKGISDLVAALSLLYAAYGRWAASEKISLPGVGSKK